MNSADAGFAGKTRCVSAPSSAQRADSRSRNRSNEPRCWDCHPITCTIDGDIASRERATFGPEETGGDDPYRHWGNLLRFLSPITTRGGLASALT